MGLVGLVQTLPLPKPETPPNLPVFDCGGRPGYDSLMNKKPTSVNTPAARKDTRNDYRHPQRMLPMLLAIEGREPPKVPTPEQENHVACLEVLASGDGQGAGVRISQRLPRARLVVYLSELACSGRELDALAASGLGWAEVAACEFLDKGGFKVLAAKAREMRTERLRETCVDTLGRMAEGIDEPVIGRVAKDRDGIVTDEGGNPVIRRRHYDRAVMFALERLSKRFQLPVAGGGGGGGNVTYNITFNGAGRPGPAVAVEAEVVADAVVPGGVSGGTLADLADEM